MVVIIVASTIVVTGVVVATAMGMAIYFAAWLFHVAWAAWRHAWFLDIRLFTINIAWLNFYAIRR